MNRSSRRLTGALTALIAALVLPAGASAAPWTPLPNGVPAAGTVVDTAVGADGTTAVAYSEGGTVKIKERPPGGAFGPGRTVGSGIFVSKLAVDDTGRTVFAYSDGGSIKVAQRVGDAFVSTPLASAAGATLDVAALSDGAVVIVAVPAAAPSARVWRRGPGAGSFTEAPSIASGGTALGPVLVRRGPGGQAVTAFAASQFDPGIGVPGPGLPGCPGIPGCPVIPGLPTTTMKVLTSVLPAGRSTFDTPRTAESAPATLIGDPFAPSFAPMDAVLHDDGKIDLAFTRSTGFIGIGTTDLKVAHGEGSAWSTGAALENIPFGFALAPAQIRLSPTGDGGVLALWNVPGPPASAVKVARRAAGASGFGSARGLADGTLTEAVIAFQSAPLDGGRTLATITRGTRVEGLVLRPDGTVDERQDLAPGLTVPPAADVGAGGGTGLAAVTGMSGATFEALTFLYDGQAPAFSAIGVPARVGVGAPVRMTAAAADRETPAGITWSFGDGRGAVGPDVTTVYDRPGTYGVEVTATDGLGNAVTERRTIVVEAPAVAAQTQPSSQARDAAAPKLTAMKLLRSRFRVGAKPTALAAAQKKQKRTASGTQLRFKLDEDARVTVAIERSRRGYQRGSRCVAKKPKVRKGKRVRRCTFVQVHGVLRRAGKAGENRLAFTGRLGRKALKPGTYRFSVVAIDRAGNAARPKRIRFTIVRR